MIDSDEYLNHDNYLKLETIFPSPLYNLRLGEVK